VPCICEDIGGGIAIYIYFPPKEHPPPHFHAICGGREASYDIPSLEVSAGGLRRKQHRIVVEWAASCEDKLMGCWARAMSGQHPGKIR
jgi:hypothetical protein